MFRRSSTPEGPQATAERPGGPVGAAGKGKATPKRREAEARRRTSVIAQGARGGGRGGRESREQYALRREALKRGDESVLPARDRGPARRFARDFVDARRSPSNYFMPVGLPVFLLSYTGIPIFQLLSYLFVLVVIIDAVVMTRHIRREVRARFPNESTRGLGLYAITRAVQLRRMRLPGPRVERGAKV